jgi:glycerophosphoryl diester phosphodiesterase
VCPAIWPCVTGAQQCKVAATLLQERAPYICAHGGATTQHPPNTAAAYAAALQAGANCMEIDAALTADLVLLALHDRDLQKLLDQPTAKVRMPRPARRRWP